MATLEQIAAFAGQGISRRDVEATIGRPMTEAEETAYRKAATIRRLKRAAEAKAAARRKREEAERAGEQALREALAGTSWPDAAPRRAPLSATERSRDFRARARDIGELPPVRHRRVREAYRFDLLGFGLRYFSEPDGDMPPMLLRAPSPRMIVFVRVLQDKILHGGLKHVRWPRGKGKTTWVKIALIWAAVYGHKRFMVVVGKTAGMAKVAVEEVWRRIMSGRFVSVDFPEFSIAMRDAQFSSQRMRVQTYHGRPTLMRIDAKDAHCYRLPSLEGYANTGAIIAYRGAKQALRGINIDSARPDFIFVDDPQTDEDARNPVTCDTIEDNISGAVLGSGDIATRISAVMATTPIEPDDVSERFADPRRHPEWETITEPLVRAWGDESLRDRYIELLAAADACPDDEPVRKRQLSGAAADYYSSHRDAIEAGADVLDPGDYDARSEISAYQHAIWLLYVVKERRFYCEYQMQPTAMQSLYALAPSRVANCLNGYEPGVIPPQCDRGVLAFVDVNAARDAALRWEIAAFGAARRVAVLAYGQYPQSGQRLYPRGLPDDQIPVAIANGLRAVAETILSSRFLRDGRAVPVSGICFDGGWQSQAVALVVEEINAKSAAPLAARSRGFAAMGAGSYSRYHHERAAEAARSKNNPDGLKAGEECHLWHSLYGVYLAFNADYWKDVSQSSFRAEPLAPNSSSFWGALSSTHFRFAQEVCAERRAAKVKHPKYGEYYQWIKDPAKPNHFGDTHAGLLAYAAIRAYYDPIEMMIAPEAAARARKPRYVYAG